MKICWFLVLLCVLKIGCILALLCSTNLALALSGGLERATVHSMRKVPCMPVPLNLPLSPDPKPGFAPDPTQCVEYELRTGKVSYIIQPHHAILLAVGGAVTIRLAGNELMLRSSATTKEIRCSVLAMTLRSEEDKKETETEHESQPGRPASGGCYTEAGFEISCAEQEAFR